ncbi:MAG: hypothetical protein HY268_18060 [Deltaproteobacteria bacterium]|nr:hypothetical protein [Deltaproteobacteria bacterium]
MALVATAAVAKPPPTPTPGQASITLTNCSAELCYANNTKWTLAKTPSTQDVTLLPDDPPTTISWIVTAMRGDTSDNILSVNGVITVTNTGTANATIGNIVVNLQTKVGSKWVSAAADVADATKGDAATTAQICSGGSSEGLSSFIETYGASGSLEFTDAANNTIFSLVPQVSLVPGQSITLLYTANFDNSVLNLVVGTQVRAEAMVTFGNSGLRGGSGATCNNIDVNGDGTSNSDEANVRTVPCRVTKTIPPLKNGNDTVTLSDMESDVTVSGTSVSVSNFTTDITNNSGLEDISVDGTFSVSVEASCDPPGSGTITNTAHLDGTSCSVTVQGPQIGTNPTTGAPIYQMYTFPCVTGVDLDASANVGVSCEAEPPQTPDACTYTQGGYAGPGAPGQLFNSNYLTVFSSGLTIGIEDNAGPRHDASWTGDVTGRSALKTYIGGGGPSGALTADTSNATSVSGGTLAKQEATLTLNIGFDTAGLLPNGSQGFDDLTLCNLVEGSAIGSFTLTTAQAAALNGMSVSQVLADTNNALGGNPLPPYVGSFGNLNQLVTALNESFDNCTASSFATANLCQP